MCTYNISIEDGLMERVRTSFKDDAAFALWMQTQVTELINNYIEDNESAKSAPTRKAHRHDALMGVIANAPDKDYRRIHLAEKYGI